MSAMVTRPDAGVFAELADETAFAKAFNEDGHVAWPTGQDLAPDAMHDEIARNGRWVLRGSRQDASSQHSARWNDEELRVAPIKSVASQEGSHVPEISRFFGIVIQMYWMDHAPPHFHAIYGSEDCAIDIRTLTVLSGQLPRRAMALTLEWAAEHREELMEDWRLCAARQTPRKIPPLE